MVTADVTKRGRGEIMVFRRFRKITQIVEDMEMEIDECKSKMDDVDIAPGAQNGGSEVYDYLDDLKKDLDDLKTRLDDIRTVL
jgi:hypothetical protein